MKRKKYLRRWQTKTPQTWQTCKWKHCSPKAKTRSKMRSRSHWERQTRNEEKKAKVLNKKQKSRKRRMRTRKGQKGEHHQAPSIHSQKKEKESCEELEHRTEPFRQQPVEDTTKRTPIAANCLEKAVKRKPQAEEIKTEQKTSPKSPQRNRPQAPAWKRQGAAAPAESPRIRTTCWPPEPSLKGRNPNVMSEPHAEEKRSWTANSPDKDRKNESSQSQEKSPQNPTQGWRQKAQARPPLLKRRKNDPGRKSRRPTEKL